MKYPMPKRHRIHRKQVIMMFQSSFQDKFETYQVCVNEKYALFISLIRFYYYRIGVMYKVIGSFIYSFIDNLLCISYLGIVQKVLCFSLWQQVWKLSSMSFLGWVFLKPWWISCHVMVFITDNIKSNSYMLQ